MLLMTPTVSSITHPILAYVYNLGRHPYRAHRINCACPVFLLYTLALTHHTHSLLDTIINTHGYIYIYMNIREVITRLPYMLPNRRNVVDCGLKHKRFVFLPMTVVGQFPVKSSSKAKKNKGLTIFIV